MMFDDANKSEEKRELAQSNANLSNDLWQIRVAQTNLPQEVSRGVNETLILATNSRISDSALAAVIKDKEAKISRSILVNVGRPDFGAFAEQYEDRIRLRNLQAEQSRREAEKTAQVEAEKARQEAERLEGLVGKKTSAVFDYTTATLHSMLTEEARLTGETNLTTTYIGLPGTIASETEDLGEIQSGSKFPWVCKISRTKWPRTLVIKYADINPRMTNALKGIQTLQWRQRSLDRQLPLGVGTNYVVSLTAAFEGEHLEKILTTVVGQSRAIGSLPRVEDRQEWRLDKAWVSRNSSSDCR